MGVVSFESFLAFMTRETTDTDSEEQIAKSFQTLAEDQVRGKVVGLGVWRRAGNGGMISKGHCMYSEDVDVTCTQNSHLHVMGSIAVSVFIDVGCREIDAPQREACLKYSLHEVRLGYYSRH